MKRHTFYFILLSLATLILYSCASLQTTEEIQLSGIASGMQTELKQFPVIFNGEHIMNIYLRYTGDTPEVENSRQVKAIPNDLKKEGVDFYHYELENLTKYEMEIFEVITSTDAHYVDEYGEKHITPPKTHYRKDLLEIWDLETVTIEPFERQIRKDTWVHCGGSSSCTGNLTFKVRIVDTGDIFSFRIILRGHPGRNKS